MSDFEDAMQGFDSSYALSASGSACAPGAGPLDTITGLFDMAGGASSVVDMMGGGGLGDLLGGGQALGGLGVSSALGGVARAGAAVGTAGDMLQNGSSSPSRGIGKRYTEDDGQYHSSTGNNDVDWMY